MALEGKWDVVPPQSFTSNGTTHGIITVADTTGFKVKQTAYLTKTATDPLPVQVKRVISSTKLVVGSVDNKIALWVPLDISAYTVLSGAAVGAEEQNKNNIPGDDHYRAIYESDPTCADRVLQVDKYGRAIDNVVDNNGVNRLAVDGQFHAEVDVQVDVDVDGYYDPTTNPDPDNAGSIGHERSNPTDQTKQTQRITAKRGTTDIDTVSQDVSIHDHNGNKFTDTNPLPTKESGPTKTVFIFGANSEHIAGIRQIIWDFSANYAFLASAENLDIISDNINDTFLGSGARSVRISGLDANYEEIEEVVNLNGTTTVTTTLQFLRRNRIQVEETGASGNNIGNITISGSSVQGYIASGINRDRSIIYTVPAGFTGKLKQIFASVGPSTNAAGVKYGNLDIFVAEQGKPFRLTNISYIMSNGTQSVNTSFGSTRDFPEKTDMALMFITEKEGAATSGFLEIFLEPL